MASLFQIVSASTAAHQLYNLLETQKSIGGVWNCSYYLLKSEGKTCNLHEAFIVNPFLIITKSSVLQSFIGMLIIKLNFNLVNIVNCLILYIETTWLFHLGLHASPRIGATTQPSSLFSCLEERAFG